MSSLHISISAEPIFHVGPLVVSNSMLTSLIASGLIVLFAVIVGPALKRTGRPNRLQTFAEMIVEALLGLCQDITGSRSKAREFLPLIMSFFLFILLNNWLGLLPGVGTIGFREHGTPGHEVEAVAPFAPKAVQASTPQAATEVTAQEATDTLDAESTDSHAETETAEGVVAEEGVFVPYFRAGTADLNTTIALALVSVVLTQVYGFKHLGISYLQKYINFKSPIMFFVGVLESILEVAKIMSFAFRLFGNIFAGEVLLAVMTFLVPVIIPMPFYGLELFVGFIQALVFSMLSLVFFNLATVGHGEEH
jgi:F-type H+-transporting ATPase subunit a